MWLIIIGNDIYILIMGEVGEDSFVYYLATGTRYYQSTNDVATLWLLDYGGGGGRFLCPYYLATGTRYYQSTNIGIPPGRKPVFHGHSVVAELQQQCNPQAVYPFATGLRLVYILLLHVCLSVCYRFSRKALYGSLRKFAQTFIVITRSQLNKMVFGSWIINEIFE